VTIHREIVNLAGDCAINSCVRHRPVRTPTSRLNATPPIRTPSQLRAILVPLERAPIGSPPIALPDRDPLLFRLHPLARAVGVPPDANAAMSKLYFPIPNSNPRLSRGPLLIELGQIQAQAQKRMRRPTEVVRSSILLPTTAIDPTRGHVPCPVRPHVPQVATLGPSLEWAFTLVLVVEFWFGQWEGPSGMVTRVSTDKWVGSQ
jgi:hypothetical protein